MMMILTALSAGISGIPLANATGNGEWVTVDMEKGHWESGEDVDATIKAESLNSTETYYLWWNVETVDGNDATNGSANLSDGDGDGVEEHAVTIASTDLYDDCWNFYADLYDSSGTLLSGTSFTFDVGTGVCQGAGPTGPSMWWNGSYWWDANDSVAYTAEVSGLDAGLTYNLGWEVTPHDDPTVTMASDSVDLTGMGEEPSVPADVGQLGDGCYEIKGMLFDADNKEIPGSGAHYLFEVGDGVCQQGPPPMMIDVYVHYYDGSLEITSYGYEANQSSLNIQITITDSEMVEVYGLDMDFTADEYGFFEYEDGSTSFDDGEYMMEVKVTNLTDDSVLFESMDMTLYVGDGGGGGDGPTIYAWLENDYSSGDEIFVGYYIDTGTGGGQGGDGPTFVCGNGDEIDFSWVNDGWEDCADGSDEPQDMDDTVDSDGDGNFTNDHDSWFDCNDANGSTVNMDVVNDGNWDCENGADEGEAPPPEAGGGEEGGDEPMLSATLNLWDDMDMTLLSTHDLDMDDSSISLGLLDDGDYKVEVILEETDSAGDSWEVDSDGFHFCLGSDCEWEGPDMLTGNASLDLSITFDDYDADYCFGGFVMLFDWYDIYMDMMSGPGDGDEDDEGDGADPVWFDWQTISGPGDFTLTGLPEGDWVVIVSIGCEDPDTGDEYGAMNIDGPWSLYNTTFTNDTTTSMSVDLQIMDEGGPDEGDDMDWETGEFDLSFSVEDSADGYTSVTMTLKVGMSDFLRADIDCAFGNCDGEVDASEAANALLMFELMGPDGGDDGGDGTEWEFYDDCSFDADRMNGGDEDGLYWCSDEGWEEGDEEWWYWCEPTPEGDYRCTDDFGHNGQPEHDEGDNHDEDDGPPPLMWNGVLLTEEDMISESMDIVGLVGMVPADESEDTGSIQMVMTAVFMLNDSGEATQILSIADEPDEYDEGDDEGDDEICETFDVYFKDSSTWVVSSIDNDDDKFSPDASGYHHATFTCDEEPNENMTVSYTRVVADEPEPPANQPPYCDVYYYAEASDLADFQSTEDKATGSNGTWEVSIVEDDTYWLMFYCTDVDGDSITVNVTSAFGDYGETFAAGSTEGYYELTIPVGSSTLSPYTLAYTWSDGTNSGSGTVTVTVAPADGGSDDSGEETEGEDTSAGSFVPGFTAVLTMTALAGAFLVFSRRED